MHTIDTTEDPGRAALGEVVGDSVNQSSTSSVHKKKKRSKKKKKKGKDGDESPIATCSSVSGATAAAVRMKQSFGPDAQIARSPVSSASLHHQSDEERDLLCGQPQRQVQDEERIEAIPARNSIHKSPISARNTGRSTTGAFADRHDDDTDDSMSTHDIEVNQTLEKHPAIKEDGETEERDVGTFNTARASPPSALSPSEKNEANYRRQEKERQREMNSQGLDMASALLSHEAHGKDDKATRRRVAGSREADADVEEQYASSHTGQADWATVAAGSGIREGGERKEKSGEDPDDDQETSPLAPCFTNLAMISLSAADNTARAIAAPANASPALVGAEAIGKAASTVKCTTPSAAAETLELTPRGRTKGRTESRAGTMTRPTLDNVFCAESARAVSGEPNAEREGHTTRRAHPPVRHRNECNDVTKGSAFVEKITTFRARNAMGPSTIRARPSIWEAVRNGDTSGAHTALMAGADIDDADYQGRTPLMVACASGDVTMASILVNEACPAASVAARTIEGWTPLMIACGGGRLEVVKVLLEAGAAILDRDTTFRSNPVMWACGGGHSQVVRVLLERDDTEALIESVNCDMWTPLMIACDAGSLDTVRILVEGGADLGAYNKDGHTALDVAASCHHLLIKYYLTTEGATTSAEFWEAADSGNALAISKLLRGNGHLVGVLDTHGRTALLRTCVGGYLEVAKILVEAGADDSLIECMVHYGFDTEVVEPKDILHSIAASHACASPTRPLPLPDRVSKVDFQDISGTSSLSVAVVVGHIALTRYLVQAGGATLSLRNRAGLTPLMQAVLKGDLVMARYLVDRGAAVNDGSHEGDSIVDMARRFSGPALQRYLTAKGGFSAHDVKRQIGEVYGGERGLFRFW